MRLTLYNNKYEFTEILDDEYIEEYDLANQEEFDMWVEHLKSDSFGFGWLECIFQSDLLGGAFESDNDNLFIKFTK